MCGWVSDPKLFPSPLANRNVFAMCFAVGYEYLPNPVRHFHLYAATTRLANEVVHRSVFPLSSVMTCEIRAGACRTSYEGTKPKGKK